MRDYNAQADIVVSTLMQAQNEIFELGQMADYYGDDVTTEACDFAYYLLECTAEHLKLPDPRFEDDNYYWWSLTPGLEDNDLPVFVL